MLRPSVAGRLLQGLLPQPHEQVLEIGAGTGFITSCLRAMSAGVSSLEIHPDLADSARGNLAALGVRGVEVLDANALLFETGTRFDAIAVTASLPLYDERFARMLKIGGRLFIVVGEAPVMQAQLVRRTAEDSWSTQSLFETVIDPLVNAVRLPEFTF
jgi:protein-L-isoaspartate(D-aspartate) O-methyltransferase